MKKFLGYILIFISFVLLNPGNLWAKSAFPKPTGYVNDFANILSYSAKDNLTRLITELERKSSAEISVVTVDSIGALTIEEYAVDLFKEWGIGKKDKDNGILILVAMQERKIRIEVGYGLEGVITDGTAGEIIKQKMTPAFKAGDFEKGIFNATLTVANLIANNANIQLTYLDALPSEDYKLAEERQTTHNARLIGNLLFIFFIILIFGARFFIFPFLFLGGSGFWDRGNGGFSGGSFGGFGGGSSGGGGASGSW